jgi:3-oxoacyl-[acyl-carrier protein] reductase
VRLIETAGGVASSLVFDITSDDEVERAMHELEKSDGTLHVLINNAGVAPYPNRLHEADQHDWRRVLDVNLTGPFLVTRAFLPMMLRAGAGSIINIASLIGLYQAAERLTLGGIHKSPAT